MANSSVVFGKGHVTSIQGILKVLELVLLLIACLCISYYGWSADTLEAFMSAVIIGTFVCVLLLVVCSSENGSNYERILSFQCFFHLGWCIFLLATIGSYLNDNSEWLDSELFPKSKKAGCAFGIMAAIVYLVDAVHSFIAYRPF